MTASKTEKSRILIADDNQPNVELLEAYLAGLDVETAVAVDGQDTLSKVASFRPDLILLDIMMPKLDGIEVCRRLRADTSLPFIPIILVTAKSDPKDIVAALEAARQNWRRRVRPGSGPGGGRIGASRSGSSQNHSGEPDRAQAGLPVPERL